MNPHRPAAPAPGRITPQAPPRTPPPVYAVPSVYEVPPVPPPLPPQPPPPRAARRSLKLVGLIAFCLAFGALGAVLVPSLAPAPPPGEPSASVSPTPRPEPGEPGPAPKSEPPAEPDAPPVPTLLARPLYAAPAVAPRPPDGTGVARLAGAIDRELDRALADAGVPSSPLADDAEFLRRVYLDLTGNVPTLDQAVAFLDSREPHKRSRLIDSLIDGDGYGHQFARVWRDLLVKRDLDNNKNLPTNGFTAWLTDRFNRNEKWDRLATALLTAEGKDEAQPATFFFLANQDNNQPSPAKLAGAVGNLFLGIQLQCAECHVHPHTQKWTQDDFWGVAAFFTNVRFQREGLRPNRGRGPVTVVEADRPAGRALPALQRRQTAPAGPTIAVPDPTNPRRTVKTVRAKFFEGKQPSMAKGPYRPHLARWAASTDNPYFAKAMVNRLWAHFFARGLVNPLDDMNPDNKPSHPGLLRLLADEFTRSGYDQKLLVRAICNTKAYQRTSRPQPGVGDDKLFAHMAVKVLDAEVLLDALTTATRQKVDRAGGRRPGGAVAFFDTREADDDPTEYSYGIPQVLRLMNTNLSAGSEVVARLTKQHKEPGKVIEGLFLGALARRPSPAESERMARYVAKQGDPAKGYAGVLWALLNSAEFACNR